MFKKKKVNNSDRSLKVVPTQNSRTPQLHSFKPHCWSDLSTKGKQIQTYGQLVLFIHSIQRCSHWNGSIVFYEHFDKWLLPFSHQLRQRSLFTLLFFLFLFTVLTIILIVMACFVCRWTLFVEMVSIFYFWMRSDTSFFLPKLNANCFVLYCFFLPIFFYIAIPMLLIRISDYIVYILNDVHGKPIEAGLCET